MGPQGAKNIEHKEGRNGRLYNEELHNLLHNIFLG